MAYISWFQRKSPWIILAIGTLIFLLYQICKKEDADHPFLQLQKTRHDIIQLQKELQRLRQDVKHTDLSQPTIFLITPTYTRYTQQADLVRMSNTLKHVNNLNWIIVEDSEIKTDIVSSLLKETGLVYTHLNIRTQKDLILGKNDPRWKKHRGLDQRNYALNWLRKNVQKSSDGVVYFADDDNTYHLDLFQEMRSTIKISIWPVALVGGLKWEGPICKNGKVINFHTAWQPTRTFPVDMAAFALNLKTLLEHPNVFFDANSQRGWIETDFLSKLELTIDDLEAKALNCMKILVWHTQTVEPKMKEETKLMIEGKGSDPRIIV